MQRPALLPLGAGLALSTSAGVQQKIYDGSATWRFEFAKDVLFDSDNQFTNGFALQKQVPAATSLYATTGTAAFGNSLARIFLPDTEALY